MKPRARRRTALLALLTAAALTLTACSAAAPSTEDAATSNDVLNVTVPDNPRSLDPLLNRTPTALEVSRMIFEGLFALDAKGIPRPMLVDDYTVSDDGLRYAFTLRKGVTFQNGRTLTGKDVVASLKRWMLDDSTGRAVKKQLAGLDTDGALAVTLTLTKPRFALLAELAAPGAAIAPAPIVEKAPLIGFDEEQTIGTGPYRLTSWKVNERIVLTRYDDYASRDESDWGGLAGAKKANIKTVVFHIVGDQDAMVNGLDTGRWDYTQPQNSLYEQLKDNPHLRLTPLETREFLYLVPNQHTGTLFAKKKAREALNLAVSKRDVAAVAGGKHGLATATGAFASPTLATLHSDAGEDVFSRHDPKKAKRLLRQAGYRQDDTVRILYLGGPALKDVAVLVQNDLATIGVDAQIVAGARAGKMLKQPTGWGLVLGEASASDATLASRPFLSLPNAGGWTSPEAEKELAAYAGATDQKTAQAAARALQGLLWDDLAVIGLAQTRGYAASTRALRGCDPAVAAFWNCTLHR